MTRARRSAALMVRVQLAQVAYRLAEADDALRRAGSERETFFFIGEARRTLALAAEHVEDLR